MKNFTFKKTVFLIFVNILLFGGCQVSTTFPAQKNLPEIIHIGMASPNIIEILIEASWVKSGELVPYQKQPGDTVVMQRQHRFIRRDGKMIGCLVGPENNMMKTLDSLYGVPLDISLAENPHTFRLTEMQGPIEKHPEAVYRKSKPLDHVRSPAVPTYGMEHTLFLKMPDRLVPGKEYSISFPDSLFSVNSISFTFDPDKLRSEAVHVSQVGFRPDDPVKLAFLSSWMGTGNNLVYSPKMSFHLVKYPSGERVYSGEVKLAKPMEDPTNRSYTDIYQMDFSTFTEPGTYRVVVENMGCSFPFKIENGVWTEAFVKSMRGLFQHRSGIALEEPYSDFKRPRSFHPEDGVKVYISDPSGKIFPEAIPSPIPEINFKPQHERFQRWISQLTPQVLPNAWGGYRDAGDWDRRADHALMPLMMFDLEEMFPGHFKDLKFNIPESGDNIPDLINEALWKVDFLKRMQMSDGSVFGAIESADHPRRGEPSWLESLPVFAYNRTRSVAYNFVAVAARAALWFKKHNMPEKATEYEECLFKALKWAEKEGESETNASERRLEDAICLANAEMYRLTGDNKYNQKFLELSRFRDPSAPFYISAMGPNGDAMGQAGWTYLMTDHPGVDKNIRRNIRESMVRDMELMIANITTNDFHWARAPHAPIRWGALSMPESQALCRAHFVTGKEEYLNAIILSTLSGAGANPLNLSYVTKVGNRWPRYPLDEDANATNQELFEGVTMGGPEDTTVVRTQPEAMADSYVYPDYKLWPVTEYYLDVVLYLTMNEWTVHQTMLPTSFVWGYLGAREKGWKGIPKME